MIYEITSSLPSFKTLRFKPGLNVLVAKKEKDATDQQTRNRAGKSSMVEIVHFLLGSKVTKDSIFKNEALEEYNFSMTLNLHGVPLRLVRRGCTSSHMHIYSPAQSNRSLNKIKIADATDWFGSNFFGLENSPKASGSKPSFRSLFSYFARRHPGGFITPEKHAEKQHLSDSQISIMYLLGLDWKIASSWQKVRNKEKSLLEVKNAAKQGTFTELIGSSSELRTSLALQEAKLKEAKSQIAEFKVLPQYRQLEAEADEITKKLNDLSNQNTIDLATIRELNAIMEAEDAPTFGDLEQIYSEAGVVLPKLALKRYEDVRNFHLSVIKNRRDYLEEELTSALARVASRESEKTKLADRRVQVMEILKSHGALDQYTMLQTRVGRLQATVENLKKKYELSEQIENTTSRLSAERSNLKVRLRRDFAEQEDRWKEAIVAFESISTELYDSAGSMSVDHTNNGPKINFTMPGAKSKGIHNMLIFCFDLMLMKICAKKGIGPGFLIHDSHLFDGVDGRQVNSALKIGAREAEEMGFQYIVTMNEDDAMKEQAIDDFDVRKYFLPVELTDAEKDGGLFGIRF